MSERVRDFGVFGVWDRQRELLKEAEMLHRASAAVRAARRTARRTAKRGAAVGATVLGAPRRAGSRRSGGSYADPRQAAGSRRSASTRRRSTPPGSARTGRGLSWRAAAARMGSSLVAVGRRLEHFGGRQRE